MAVGWRSHAGSSGSLCGVLEGVTVIPLMLPSIIDGLSLLARMGAARSGGDSSGSAAGLTLAIRSQVGRYFGTDALISLVALKVAAEHKPSWSRVLDFLAPNEKWTPRSLEHLRRFRKRGATVRSAPESPPSAAGSAPRPRVAE